MRKNLKYVLLALFLAAMVYAGCTYEYSLDPYHNKVNPNGAKVDTTGVTDYEGISISNSFLPVDFDGTERKVLEADTASGRFTMKADDATLKKLGVGSIVAFDTDSLMYLRKVKKIHIENGVAEMETEQANPFEVIREGRFAIEVDGKSPIVTRSTAGFEDGQEYPVFRPSEVRYRDADGNWYRKSYYEPKTRGESDDKKEWEEGDTIEGEGSSKHQGSVAYDKQSFTQEKTVKITTKKKREIEFDVNVELTHSFKECSDFEMVFDLHLFQTSKIFVCKSYDTFDTLSLSIDLSKGGDLIEEDDVDQLKKVLHIDREFRLTTLVIMIGAFPLVIDIQFVPDIAIEIGATANLHFEMQSVEIKKGMRSGFQFYSDTGLDIIDDDGEVVKDQFGIKKFIMSGEAKSKFSFTPKLNFMLYGLVGPYIGVEFYSEYSLKAGMGYSDPEDGHLLEPEDWTDGMTAGYQIKDEVGINLVAGIDISILEDLIPGLEDGDLECEKSVELVKPYAIFEAPSSIVCHTQSHEIHIGKRNELAFRVHSTLFGSQKNFNLPYYINFESTGDELLYYETDDETDDGIGFSMPTNRLAGFSPLGGGPYKIIWTPTSMSSTLVAYINGPDGDEISSVRIKPSSSAEHCVPVDMGTSCLWSPLNIGADQQQECGDYVGWGDATGKHKEQGAYSSADGTTEADDEVLKGYYGGKKASNNISGGGRDYATAKWGGTWRMPTMNEWQELIDNCDWVWNAEYKCFEITSRITGAKLVLPANGYRLGTEYADVGHHCNYWSANLYTKTKDRMEAYYFSGRPNRAENRRLNANYHTPRYFGQGVRPVMDKPNEYDFSDEDY